MSEPPHIEIPPHQAPHAPNHAPWMDLSTHISSLGTRMEDRMNQYQTGFTSQFEYMQQRFERMKDHMDQQQIGFTSWFESLKACMDQHQVVFEHLQQKIERIEGHLESQHEEMMSYLRSMFPSPPPQP